MECKYVTENQTEEIVNIKIYPEWNVNIIHIYFVNYPSLIKIYPEWNVNNEVDLLFQFMSSIKIYPEWNVNRFFYSLFNISELLKSTQSGM